MKILMILKYFLLKIINKQLNLTKNKIFLIDYIVIVLIST